MYLWRFSIAITLGLLWFFSDSGQVFSQYFVFFLCFLSTPVLLKTITRECSTQTDQVFEETKLQPSGVEERLPPYDIPDGDCNTHQGVTQYPHIEKSLKQVFECAYAQLVQPWYCVPEPCESQPLHQVLCREFDLIIDRVISRAKDFDVCEAIVGAVCILTQHLRNVKKPHREPLFSSRAEEVTVLRVFSEALVRNLFPEPLWGLDVNRCALNEIVAIKGLELVVTWLSDPDNLNQLVVNQLDDVTSKSPLEELCGSDTEQASPSSHGDQGDANGVISKSLKATENSLSIRKSKKRAKKFKEGWSKFVGKMKPKKTKTKVEIQSLMMQCAYNYGDGGSDVSSREGSIDSQQHSEGEDSDLEDYQPSVQENMMEFKLSYEMWRVGQWTVCIPYVDWVNPELRFTVHLEEKHNPENLHWDIIKTHMDVISFRTRWQDSTNLPLISVPEEISEGFISDEVNEEYKRSVEHFLQEVVADNLIGHTQPVFQFLCPLDKLLNEKENYGGVWGLLSSVAYFLTPGQEEEEPCDPITNDNREEAVVSDADSTVITENCTNESDSTIPTVNISPIDSASEPSDEEAPKESQCFEKLDLKKSECDLQNVIENLDNSVTPDLKMVNKQLTKSQESLPSIKASDQISPASVQHTSQDRGFVGGNVMFRCMKQETFCLKMSGELPKIKTSDQRTLPKGEDPLGLKNQVSWEQHDATKAIFDLLKEISGNSFLLSILKPAIPILRKKVNSILNKINLTEAQTATYIDTLCAKLWPDGSPLPPTPPRTAEEKSETRARAHHLLTSKYSNNLILKKTDVETVFKAFQDSEQNKNLAYLLLSSLLREVLPGEAALNESTIALQKVNNCGN